MNKENTTGLAESQVAQPRLSGGLYLKGTVIAVRTEDKEFEGKKYTVTTSEISDGESVFSMRHTHDAKPYTAPRLFDQITVRVTYATTEKGKISVKGQVI